MTKYYNRQQHNPKQLTGKDRIFKCDQCTCKPDCPMLKDEVWLIIAGPRDLLCIYCTERLLGRRLTVDDLLECVGNAFTFYLEDVRNGVDKAPRLDR